MKISQVKSKGFITTPFYTYFHTNTIGNSLTVWRIKRKYNPAVNCYTDTKLFIVTVD